MKESKIKIREKNESVQVFCPLYCQSIKLYVLLTKQKSLDKEAGYPHYSKVMLDSQAEK